MAVLEKAVEVSRAYSGVKMLVYGPAGAGKTTLARTMPKPVLVLDFEGGVLALLGEPEVLVCPIESASDLLEACRELARDTRFRSVVFDGFSLFVKRRVQELRGSKERVTWSEWQQLTSELRAAILPLLHLKKHLLLTALPRYRTDNNTLTFAEPDLTPAIRKDIVAACDLVGYLVAPNDPLFGNSSERTILFASDKAVTKSRIPHLTASPPNFSEILKLANLPELQPTESKISVVVPKWQNEQQHSQHSSEQGEQRVQEAQHRHENEAQEVSSSQDLTSQIFNLARKLGMTNQSLGRLAKQHFGKSFIKDLSEEQKRKLLEVMSAIASKNQSHKPQPDQSSEPTTSETVEFFIQAWRSYRNYDSPFPHERELAAIAVAKGWQFDELEAIVAERLIDKGVDLSEVDERPYWLANIDADILNRVVEDLASE